MLRPAPSFTLFPYTTLFRSLAFGIHFTLVGKGGVGDFLAEEAGLQGSNHAAFLLDALEIIPRSEEHTSELQSLTNLVCRLLLEKKKKTFNTCFAAVLSQSTN